MCIYGTYYSYVGHQAPYSSLKLSPPPLEKVETKVTLRASNRAVAKVSELKGMARLIPNQQILINALTIKESKDSSEIENIITSEDETIGKINSIITLLDSTIEEVKSRASKIYRKELVEILFEHPYAKIEYLVQHLGIERKAASRYLRKLEEINILESHKIGRETIYVNIGLMKILKE